MSVLSAFSLIQRSEAAQSARDLSQQIREQIRAAREEARAAQKSQVVVPGPAGTPVVQVPFEPLRTMPRQGFELTLAFFFTVAVILLGLPIARAFARRMDRGNVIARIPPDVSNQLTQLSQAVDAIALEVERISEGQRFTTRLLSEQKQTAQGALAPPAV